MSGSSKQDRGRFGRKGGKATEAKLLYHRIVVKAGTSVLTAGDDRLDLGVIEELVGQIAQLQRRGAQVILVTSGAIASGKEALGTTRERRDVPFRQVLAAVGQSHLMRIYDQLFAFYGIKVAQALLTRNDFLDRQGYLNVRNTLIALLEMKVMPVVNENDVVAVEEIEEVFGDNDRLSALVANLVDADLLAVLTDTDGLYTADPHLEPEARLVHRVERVDSSIEALAGKHRNPGARGGMPTKLEAAKLASASGVSMVICNGVEPNVLLRLSEGEELGTLFLPVSNKMESRKRWMLSVLSNRGEIVIDQGAVSALLENNRSLLPAGVKEVRGDFHRGDIVYIVGPDSSRVACGMANYSAADMARIKGARSDGIDRVLGYHYGQEAVHRNNMVLL